MGLKFCFDSSPQCSAVVLVAGGVGYYVAKKCSRVNVNCIEKEKSKVAHKFDIEDLPEKGVSFCRCWRSKNFPYCDGSHNKHNEQTGDNVGPVVLKHKE